MKSLDTNRWYPIASATDLPSRHVYQTSLAGQELALWRDDNGMVNAWENTLPSSRATPVAGREPR
ncbi:Rieske 2Fe-2S domain-containing protein (plasmid) [Cupriavidus basilensis]